MKRFISITLCLVYLLLIAGCGNTDNTSVDSSPSIEGLKPTLSVQELYSAYMEKITEYEEKYGKLSKPYMEPGSDGYSDMLNGVAYVDLIDFNKDNAEELVLVYYRPYGDDNPSPYEDAIYDGCMFMTVFAAQGEDIVRVFEYKLPASEYRCINSCTVHYGLIDNQVYIFNCMDYYLHMPEVEPNEYQSVDDHNQWFTADCYYGYDGSKFKLLHKKTWQGEGMNQVLMYNDEIYTYNSDENVKSPIPPIFSFEERLSADRCDSCIEKISKVKEILVSGIPQKYVSFEEQTKFSDYREIADHLLVVENDGSVRDADGIYEITDETIVEKNGVVEFVVTFTYFDEAYKEYESYREKTREVNRYYVDLSTGLVYTNYNNQFLSLEYLW